MKQSDLGKSLDPSVERTEIMLGNKILAKYYIFKTEDYVPMLKEKNM